MAAEGQVDRGTVRERRDRALAWAAEAWVVVAPAVERGAAALAVGAADPARVVAAERTCGNPAEAATVLAAAWERGASGPALAVAARARAVEAAQVLAVVAEQEAAQGAVEGLVEEAGLAKGPHLEGG